MHRANLIEPKGNRIIFAAGEPLAGRGALRMPPKPMDDAIAVLFLPVIQAPSRRLRLRDPNCNKTAGLLNRWVDGAVRPKLHETQPKAFPEIRIDL